MKKQLTPELLQQLKECLPKGWADSISQKLNITPAYVRMVANGKVYSNTILKELVKLAKKEKNYQNKIKQEITQL